MLNATKTIITAAIKADTSMTPSAKSKIIRALTQPKPDDIPTMRFFTERQAGIILGVSARTIRRMKLAGELQTKMIHGTRRITADSVYSI